MQISKNTIPIWLDCDPGHDDVVAMLLAVFHKSFNLLGISASFGNAPIEETEHNALSIITAFGKTNSVKVYHGAPRGWLREPEHAPDIHGLSGLDGTTLLPTPAIGVCQRSHLEAIEEAIMAHKNEISLVSTGSMTTIATLLRDKPYLLKYIKYIAIMGGGISVGNVNPNFSAEFNVWIDPHSANFIFTNTLISAKCILVPLDLTHQAIATKEIRKRILGDGTSNMRKLFYELFEYFSKSCEITQAFFDGPPVHDPVALVPLLQFYDPSLEKLIRFEYERMDLEVTLDSIEDLGNIRCVKKYDNSESKGVMVGKSLNFDFFWDAILECLQAASLSSTIEEKSGEKEYI